MLVETRHQEMTDVRQDAPLKRLLFNRDREKLAAEDTELRAVRQAANGAPFSQAEVAGLKNALKPTSADIRRCSVFRHGRESAEYAT